MTRSNSIGTSGESASNTRASASDPVAGGSSPLMANDPAHTKHSTDVRTEAMP